MSEPGVGPTSPQAPVTVDGLLAAARAALDRLEPPAAMAAREAGAVLIDIRAESERARDGAIPGARLIPRNVLEWRLDPRSDRRDREIAESENRVILICQEGYQSSLAAATLRRLGVDATDVVDGFQGWRAAGLPIEPTTGAPAD